MLRLDLTHDVFLKKSYMDKKDFLDFQEKNECTLQRFSLFRFRQMESVYGVETLKNIIYFKSKANNITSFAHVRKYKFTNYVVRKSSNKNPQL